MPEAPDASPAPLSARAAPLAALAAVVALHLAGIVYFAAPAALSDGALPLNDAFGVEVYRAARTRLAAASSTGFSVYDPSVLAGQRAGLAEPLDTKGYALGLLALHRFGVPPLRALGLLVLAGHVLFPWIGLAAARVFRLSSGASVGVAALWSALWFFDSLTHALWFTGRMPWVMASGMVVLAAGAAQRVASGGARRWALLAAAALAAAAVLHPAPALFGAAAVATLAGSTTSLLVGRRLSLFAAALAPLPVLAVFTTRWGPGSSEPLAHAFDAGPVQLAWDVLELRGGAVHLPGAPRTLVRTLCLAAGVLGLRRARAVSDSRLAAAAWVAGGGLALGYGGGLVPLDWPVDPYAFVVPATLTAAVPAAAFFAGVPWRATVLGGPRALKVALSLAALLVIPRAYRTVATFVPELLPERVIHGPPDRGISALVGLNEPHPDPLRHEPPSPDRLVLVRWLSDHASGRVLVDDAALAALIATSTPLGVLGPIAERGSLGAPADPTPFLLAPSTSRDALAAFVERYAVTWVVASRPGGPFDGDVPGLEPPAVVAGHRVRRVAAPTTLVAEGEGRVAWARLGSIAVTGAAGPRVTLRYHHDPGFRCHPDCRVEGRSIGGAIFVSVVDPPGEFEVRVE